MALPLTLVPLLMLLSMCLTPTVGIHIRPHSHLPVGGKLSNGGKIWALLVAGSNGYYNYRHQADVCHAYQILHKNGIPADQIITMMYDDVARAPDNPTPNVIINRPGGPNVYKGVPIDYSGDAVNSTNFLAVLTGNQADVSGIGSERVIESGPQDHIFINFVDHGAPGFLCFPSDELHASRLESTLQSMVSENRFSKMVLYVEACESGSMFENILPDTSNIFVMTAADPRESSYACYFDNLRGTYLGDVFSVKWMENSDVENLAKETIHHQFEVVRSETNTSHVEEYGNLDIGSLPVAYFQGHRTVAALEDVGNIPPIEDAVDSRDVPLEILKQQYERAVDRKTKKMLQLKIRRTQKLRRHVDVKIADIASYLSKADHTKTTYLLEAENELTYTRLTCYEELVTAFSEKCFKISENPYVLSKMKVLINICASPWINPASAKHAMDVNCDKQITGIM